MDYVLAGCVEFCKAEPAATSYKLLKLASISGDFELSKIKMKADRDKLCCNALLGLMLLYYSQQTLGLQGLIGQILLLLILVLSLLYVPKVVLNNDMRTHFIGIWFLFLTHNSLYFVFSGDYANYNFFKSTVLNFLPFFPFYYFSKKGILTREKLIAFLIISLPVFIMQIQQNTAALQLEVDKDNVIDNTIYLLVGLLPFVLLIRNKILSLLIFSAILYFVIGSNKKAAVICWAYTFFLFCFKDVYAKSLVEKIKSIAVSVIVICLFIPFAYNLYSSNEMLVGRMAAMLDGYTSGRDSIAVDLFNAWYTSDSLATYLFGLGYNATGEYTDYVSHNDWLDMLSSFGIAGLLLYAFLFGMLFWVGLRNGWDKDKRVVFIAFLGIAFLVSMTSRWYWAGFAYMNFLILPYLLATRRSHDA